MVCAAQVWVLKIVDKGPRQDLGSNSHLIRRLQVMLFSLQSNLVLSVDLGQQLLRLLRMEQAQTLARRGRQLMCTDRD